VNVPEHVVQVGGQQNGAKMYCNSSWWL